MTHNDLYLACIEVERAYSLVKLAALTTSINIEIHLSIGWLKAEVHDSFVRIVLHTDEPKKYSVYWSFFEAYKPFCHGDAYAELVKELPTVESIVAINF